MANAQTSLGKIEDSIECSICTNRFRKPKWLNCFHTFCLQCLQEICKSQGPQCNKLLCPLCRQETILTNGNVSDLLDNSEMKTLVETFTHQEKVLKQQFEQLEVFSKLVAKARRCKTEFEKFVDNLDTSLTKLEEVFYETNEKISKKADREISKIRVEEHKLKKEAENIHKTKVEFLKSLQDSNRREATQTAYILDEVNHVMAGGSDGNKKKICKDLEKASRKNPQTVPDGFTFMDFKENDERSLGKLVQNDDDLTIILHTSTCSVPSSGIPTEASPSPPLSPGVVNTPVLATGTAHDISDTEVFSRPGLAPSPHQQGNVVQQQHQPPQGMIIQSPYLIQQQMGGPVYKQRMSNQQNQPGGIQIQQAPSSGPQQMAGGSQMSPINQFMPNQPYVIPMMQPQLNMPQFQKRDPMSQPLQQAHLTQPSQQRQVYQQPQFTQQNPQGQIYTQPSTPPFYSNPQQINLQPGGATFSQSNQQGMVVTPQMRPQAYQATLPQAPQYNAAPKKKSLIRVVDPKSNQDITDSIIREASMPGGSSSPHSGQSSASGTPRFSNTSTESSSQ